MKISVIGATGLVGQKMLQVLSERNLKDAEIYAAASEKSVGKKITVAGNTYTILSVEEVLNKGMDIALFSAGASVSKQWAEKFAEKGCYVIDNSSAWRMDKNIKLIVPEINANILTKNDKIIANPNCSTIQMVVALYPLHKKYKIKRIVVSTYQAVSGSGNNALQQLGAERSDLPVWQVYPHQIHLNCFPHGGDFLADGYTTEEAKLLNETRKIFDDYSIKVSATVVRIPVEISHSESVNVEFEKDFDIEDVKNILASAPGVVVYDQPEKNIYPTPLHAADKDEVFVGRIRRDNSQAKTLNCWIVADNIRKGAATNAVQIAEEVLKLRIKKIEINM